MANFNWSRLQHHIPKLGLFITWLPGLVLLTHFLVNGITPSVQANNNDLKQEQKPLNNDAISSQKKLTIVEKITDLNEKTLDSEINNLDKK